MFKNYAYYYNLLYRDKNYELEANRIDQLIKTHNPRAQTILDLGCGTGNHAFFLIKLGYTVVGIDRSIDMLDAARDKLSQFDNSEPSIADKVVFQEGDVRNVRLHRRFDIVTSLFHVLSYQTTNDDLCKTIDTAYVHLKSGGLFIFDCWYGPAVIADPPQVRIKRLEDKNISIIRIAEPEINTSENVVNINYQVLIKNNITKTLEEIKETHRMRYLFEKEIKLLFSKIGLELIHSEEWMTGKKPGVDTWYVCFMGQRKTI